MTAAELPDDPGTPSSDLDEVREALRTLHDWVEAQVLGQEKLVNRLLIALLADGHLLVEGAPGLAKTRAIKTLAAGIDGDFHRIQFTPDLLPGDLTGSEVYRPQDGSFHFQRGPLFHNLVLADEINRAPAKVQSALLEAMAERQITVGAETYLLPQLFLVMATQNPIEQEGTYPLPEAQVDRFMLKVKISYPNKEEEREIIRRNLSGDVFAEVHPVVKPAEILKARESVRKIYMDEKIERYILDIVFATRTPGEYGLRNLEPLINYGGSPRASINLALASKAHAFIQRRGYVIPEDVRNVCHDVMRHRLGLTYEAEAENITQEDIINKVLDTIEVP